MSGSCAAITRVRTCTIGVVGVAAAESSRTRLCAVQHARWLGVRRGDPVSAEADVAAVRAEGAGPVARLVIDNPESRNALSPLILRGLADGIERAVLRADARVIVITGAGSSFSAGADLRASPTNERPELLYRRVCDAIVTCPKPVIARVNGHTFGGAIGLVAACDLSIAAEDAQFGFTEVRLGLVPTLASVTALSKLRLHDALELVLLGRRFDGRRAAEVGLVNRAVPSDALDTEIEDVVSDLLAGGPLALAACKSLIRHLSGSDPGGGFDYAIEVSKQLSGTPEAIEGRAAFVEKRRPSWQC